VKGGTNSERDIEFCRSTYQKERSIKCEWKVKASCRWFSQKHKAARLVAKVFIYEENDYKVNISHMAKINTLLVVVVSSVRILNQKMQLDSVS